MKLQISDSTIDWSLKAKYLGITIDRRLSFKDQVRHTIQKAKQAALYPVLFQNSPIPMGNRISIFRIYIRPLLTYAIPAWGPLISATNWKKLEAVQNIALRTITGTYYLTRNSTILASLNTNTIQEESVRLAKACVYRASISKFPLLPIFQFIKRTVPQITMVHFLTDSPTTQYRNRTIFYLIANALQHSIECSVCTWNYMEAGLSKGAPDGIEGCLKRTADRVFAQGEDINSFETFVKVLKENVRKVEIILVHKHDIQSIKSILPSEIPSFKVHQVVFMKEYPNNLIMRRLSCFDCDKYSLGHHIISPTNEYCPENFHIHTPSRSGLQSKNTNYAPGTYLLVKFENNSKKSADAQHFSYVCCVEKQNDDRTINVNGLKKIGNSLAEFVVTKNDKYVIGSEQVLQVLPNPNFVFKKRKMVYVFPFEINVKKI